MILLVMIRWNKKNHLPPGESNWSRFRLGGGDGGGVDKRGLVEGGGDAWEKKLVMGSSKSLCIRSVAAFLFLILSTADIHRIIHQLVPP